MPEQKIPDVLAHLVSQLRGTSANPQTELPLPPAAHFVFHIGEGGILQVVFGNGALNSAPHGGLKDA